MISFCTVKGVLEKYPEKVHNIFINANIRIKCTQAILLYSMHIIQMKEKDINCSDAH